MPRAETLQLGQTLRGLTRRHSAGLIVNDDISLAVAVGADGVHLGQDDAAVCEARSALGAGAIVGVSAGTAEEARRAVEDGADYIGVGCVFGTATKDDAGEAIGVDGLAEVVQAVQGRVPVVAIGGVDERNAGRCIRAGADGVAVVGAVMRGGRPGQATAGLARIVREGREARGKAPGG